MKDNYVFELFLLNYIFEADFQGNISKKFGYDIFLTIKEVYQLFYLRFFTNVKSVMKMIKTVLKFRFGIRKLCQTKKKSILNFERTQFDALLDLPC